MTRPDPDLLTAAIEVLAASREAGLPACLIGGLVYKLVAARPRDVVDAQGIVR
jgi:hypothetical protein